MALHAQSWPQGPSGRSSHGFGSEGEYLVRSGWCRSAAVRDLASPAMPWYRPRNDEGTAKRNARPSLSVIQGPPETFFLPPAMASVISSESSPSSISASGSNVLFMIAPMKVG